MPRALALTAALVSICCAIAPTPRPASFPPAPAWKTLLADFVVPPLASGGHRIFVATRDGEVRALDERTGALLWKASDLPGTLAATDGLLLVRSREGRVTSLQPRTGAVRWSVETGVAGALPVVLDDDRAIVAGGGFAGVELATGRVLFTDRSGAEITAAPVPIPTSAMVLTAEADGLRCRDRATGIPIWTLRTSRPLLAPPLVGRSPGVLYLGTTDKRILQVKLAHGSVGWRWTVGADVAHPGLLTRNRVLFASFDAVLYALRRNGNLAWRASLPSRPLSGPLVAGEYLIVACLENELVAIAPETGHRAASMRTSAEIRTPPMIVNDLLVIGLRDRSVVAYTLPGATRPTPRPGTIPPVSAPVPAPVERPEPDR